MHGEKTDRKQRKLREPWKPGQSGNPTGRPKGARNKATLAAEALLDGEAEQITRKAIEKAKAGDMVAIRLCLDRIAPPEKTDQSRSPYRRWRRQATRLSHRQLSS